MQTGTKLIVDTTNKRIMIGCRCRPFRGNSTERGRKTERETDFFSVIVVVHFIAENMFKGHSTNPPSCVE